jgi:hypothetical protein
MLKLVGVVYHKSSTLNVIRAAVACVQNEVQKYDGTVRVALAREPDPVDAKNEPGMCGYKWADGC